jgi:stage II sporulation protein D (peptidoglycan lytic transglycosylase)
MSTGTLIRVAASVALVATAFGCAGPRPGAPGARTGAEPIVRVLVFSTSGTATLATTGPFAVKSGGMTLLSSARGGTATIQRTGQSLQVRLDTTGETAVAENDLVVAPTAAAISVGGVWYAGSIRARANEMGGIDLINLVGVETYLEGVVPHEIGDPGADGYAAVEAQAVAARTYAMSRITLNHDHPYDLESGVADQVYRGREKDSRTAASAIRETRGMVLDYKGELCETYYSATCGGHTSDIRTVWPDRKSAPYLYGCLDRPADGGESFCAQARNFRWRYTFSGRSLGATIRQTLPAALGIPAAHVGDLVDLRIVDRAASGRVSRLDVVTSTGTFRVDGDKIRRVLMLDVQRGKILPSTLFDIESVMTGGRVGRVSIVGGGNGHGVGMCQNGAIGMARRGYSYSMILEHYYSGATLRAAY